MRIFITRHGQVAPEAEYLGDPNYPEGDMPLSAIGFEQSHLIGKRLSEEGFSGTIFSSPYIRTMQTSNAIAEEVGGAEIVKVDGLRERDFDNDESAEEVRYRVALAMREIMKHKGGDVLIVGHGATVGAVLQYLFATAPSRPVANCSYSFFDTKEKDGVINCVKHLPYAMITQNRMHLSEKPAEIELPEELVCAEGIKLLHIGDTHSRTYYWYRALINKLKPDVIIHTGDTADEIKVGRMPETEAEYLDRVRVLLDIMTESGAEVYWTTGNNDLEEKVAEIAPTVKIIPNNTVLNIGGKRIAVTHNKCDFTVDADIYLYGHSLRYEEWSCERNVEDEPVWYLNANWRVFALTLPERKLFSFPLPKKW